MDYSILFYIVFTFIAAYGISGINFNGWIRKGKEREAKILAICLSFALGYLLTRFVLEFLSLSTII